MWMRKLTKLVPCTLLLKQAGQWFALPKLFKSSVNEGYEITKNEPGLIQFKNEQVYSLSLPSSSII